MTWLRRALARLTGTFRGHQAADADLRAELESHLALAADEYRRRGMTPEAAWREARRVAGNLVQAEEAVRAQRALPWVEALGADARFASRQWRRAPLATLTIVLVLSLGLGTNIVLLSVLTAVTTRPAPGLPPDPSVVRIRGAEAATEVSGLQPRLLSWPEVQEYAARPELFGGVAAHADETAMVSFGSEAGGSVPARLVYVTSNYLEVLGLRPVLGTGPSPEPDVTRLTAPPTAMISHAVWRERFGGTTSVLGQVVRINGMPVEIVGVAPPRFLGTGGGDPLTVWLPLAAYPALQQRSAAVFGSPDSLFLSAAARLAPGASLATATAAVASLAARVPGVGDGDPQRSGQGPATADVVPMRATNARISDGSDQLVSGIAAGGFALLVLLITCINVSALLVGLAAARRQEVGVKLALGAPRRRLVRQLLTESVLLSLVAAGIGLLVTAAGIQVFSAAFADLQLVVDWRVAVAAAVIAILTGIGFGLSPALHATRVPVQEALRQSASSLASARSRLQRGLVVAQVALTQPLLVGLGVVVATLQSDLGTRTGPDIGAQVAEIELDTWAGRVSMAERVGLLGAVVARVAAVPGVVSAWPMQAGVVQAPLRVHPADQLEGITPRTVMEGQLEAAPPGYFQALGIPILRGRDFDPREAVPLSYELGPPAHEVAIVGSDLARRLWGDADPIGRRITLAISEASGSSGMTVVGVVDADVAGPSEVNGLVRVYVPYATVNTGVVVRTAGPALPMLNGLRAAVAAEAPQMPVMRAETVAQREEEARRRMLRTSGAVAGGGLLALLLSATGLYAVIAFSVGQRTREIGIRTTLGAQSSQVVRMFFGRGLALSGLGLLLGLPLSLLVTRWISATLNLPLASSPLLGFGIAAVVLAVASLAVWIPSRRASRVDPIVALRAE